MVTRRSWHLFGARNQARSGSSPAAVTVGELSPVEFIARLENGFDTELPGPRDIAGVFPQPAASRFINRCSEPNAGSLGCGTQDRPAHAPADAANNEAQSHRN